MAADAASFNTSIDSISFWLIVANGLVLFAFVASSPLPKPAWLSPFENGIPSTTYKGSPLLDIELVPLTRILTAPPSEPFACCTCNPGALPCNAASKLGAGVLVKTFESILETDPVMYFRCCVP